MEDAIGPGLFESFGRGVHGLSGGGKGACSQRLDVLRMADFGACVDNFLSGFKKFSGELSELKDFSFDERVA